MSGILGKKVVALTALALGLCLGAAIAAPSHAAEPHPSLDERTQHLATELRCLVCQNQSIADSQAPLALQLKAEVRRQLAQGASDEAVRQFMVQRYGDFVLYKPPLTPATWLLWAGPLALIALGGAALTRHVRTQRRRDAAGLL